MSESPGYRQTFLALEAENDSSIVAAAEEILQVIGRRSPRKAARRTVADGKRCLKVYARD